MLRLLLASMMTVMLIMPATAAIKWNNPTSKNAQSEEPKIKFEPGPLEKLTVPGDWPFTQKSNFLGRHKSFSIDNNGISRRTMTDCVYWLTNWEKNSDQHRQKRRGDGCIQQLGWWYYNSGETSPIRDVLLSWATKQKPTFDIYQNDFNPDHYDAIALLSVFSSFYAVKYDEFSFTQDERLAVDKFIQDEMLNIPIDVVGEPKNQFFCDPRKHKIIGKKQSPRPDINTCGSNRWKVTIAQLLVSLRFGNQELFSKGVYNTRFKLALFDDEGIYVTWATRGALAWDYSHDVTTMLSLLTEIYNSVGYDFLNHKNDNGLLVHQLFAKQFEIVDNVAILEKYAKRQYAVKGTDYNAWRKLSNAQKVQDWPKSSLAYSALTYINEYDKDLIELVDCNVSVFSPSVSAITTFNIVDIWVLHHRRQNKGLCENHAMTTDDQLIISWFIEMRSDNYKRVLEARDIMPIRNGAIVKSGVVFENFSSDSQNHGREKLNIILTDTTISISGEIQVFESEYITLNVKANLSEGETKIDFGHRGQDRFVISWK